MIVRRLLKEAEHLLIEELMTVATGPIFSAIGSMAADLAIQVGANAVGMQDGYVLGETLDVGGKGFSDGVDAAAATFTGGGA